jgi:capsular exopolysaccharide synthesis family protein
MREMTFRQALSAVRRGWLLVVVVVLIAMAVAAVFLVRQTPVYTSEIAVRPSSLATSAATTGQIGTASVDFDPAAITSLPVLRAAATRLGEPASASRSWDVTYATAQGVTAGSSTTLTITASGSTASQSSQRAAAVEKSYNDYLSAQIADARTAAAAQATKWTAAAEAAQQLVDKNPANSIAQSNLASAIRSLTSANSTIAKIDSAGSPLIVTKPVTPGEFQGTSPLIALAVALAAGLVAGIGIALIWDAFDDRLRPDDDVESLTGVPSLGDLTLDKTVRRGRDRLPAAGRSRTTLNEGLRSLRTTLQVLLPQGRDVVVVTSVEPGDGKTFISSNLALAWSRMGKRVVLIGGDLRKGGLEDYFGDEATGPGLTELLQEAALTRNAPSPDEVAGSLRETGFHGLSVLPAGDEPWDPADLLALDALDDVITALRGLSDVIIIDSPPSLALVDARLLAAHADGVVVVASMRRTRRRPLGETVDALVGSGATVLGVVINRSRRLIPKSYSEYYGPGRRQQGGSRERAGARPPEPIADETPELDEAVADVAPPPPQDADRPDGGRPDIDQDVTDDTAEPASEAGEPDVVEPESSEAESDPIETPEAESDPIETPEAEPDPIETESTETEPQTDSVSTEPPSSESESESEADRTDASPAEPEPEPRPSGRRTPRTRRVRNRPASEDEKV